MLHGFTPEKRAVLLMIISATIISTSGLIMRSLEDTSDWQVVFWRGLSLTAGMFIILLIENRRSTFKEIQSIGMLGLLGGVLFGGILICYVLAISNTSVANAVFTMSAAPFVTALLAWIVLGERILTITAISMAVAIVGVAFMVSDGITTGTAFGNVMALIAVLCIAGFVVILRKKRTINMLPTTAIGAFVSVLAAAIMLAGDLELVFRDLMLCLFLGGVIASTGQFLFVHASRHLLGAELTLLTLIEFILAPIWVWLVIQEVPSAMTMIGGALVLTAVGGHAMFSLVKRTT